MRASPQSYSLTRRFIALTLISILLVGSTSATVLSHFLGLHILKRDGELTMQFLQSLSNVQKVRNFFSGTENASGNRDVEQFFEHLAAMPDTLHANVYDASRKVLWSTSPNMIGRRLPANDELSEALTGRLVVHSNLSGDAHDFKAEHQFLPEQGPEFVEDYVPIFDSDGQRVMGVIELYRTPKSLFETVHRITRQVWLATLTGGLVLFLSLFWLARRTDRVIRDQQRQLIETERLAAVGELAASVAHSIRNPLASIRSSAELAMELEGADQRRGLRDILDEVDRVAAWIRDLLTFTQPNHGSAGSMAICPMLESCLVGFARELEKHRVGVRREWPESLPEVMGEPNLMSQACNSLISNAIESMAQGGTLTLSVTLHGDTVRVRIADTGHGMAEHDLRRAMRPFHTTKRSGLGVGLPLAKRIVERFGGRLLIESRPGEGTTATLDLPVSRP